MKVLCIGHAVYDISVPFFGYPEENVKHRVDKMVQCGGGPAATAAFLLGKWGVKTYFKGQVGDDEFGYRIIEELKLVGVNTSYVEITEGIDTSIGLVIINTKKGTRTILNYNQAIPEIKNNTYNFKPNLILVDGHNIKASNKALNIFPKAKSIIDAGRATSEVIALAKRVDYLVCSKDFAEKESGVKIKYSDIETLREAYEKLEKKYKNTIVITLENHGCLYKKDGVIKKMGTLKVDTIDTTGAGDIFHGAFVYALSEGYEIDQCCKIANITGALSVTKIGTRFSVPKLKEVMKVYDENK